MNQITSNLPVIIRYAVTALAALLVGAGWIGEDALPAAVQEQIVLAIVAVVGVIPVIWAIIKRPSPKALQVAKEVDKKIPADQTVVIQTPGSQPEIRVPAKP